MNFVVKKLKMKRLLYILLLFTTSLFAQKMQKVLKPLRVGAVVEGFGVPHAHIHLVPLYDAEVLKLHHGYSVKKSSEDLAEIAKKLAE